MVPYIILFSISSFLRIYSLYQSTAPITEKRSCIGWVPIPHTINRIEMRLRWICVAHTHTALTSNGNNRNGVRCLVLLHCSHFTLSWKIRKKWIVHGVQEFWNAVRNHFVSYTLCTKSFFFRKYGMHTLVHEFKYQIKYRIRQSNCIRIHRIRGCIQFMWW